MHGSTFTIKKSFEIIKIPFSSIYSLEFLQELIGAIDELEAEAKDVELSGVIIQSSSKSVFSAGLDLQEMLKPDRARLTEFWSNLQEFWIRLYGCQVWPLTQFFFCFLFVNDLLMGKYFSLPFLPATPLSPSRTLKGLFELTRCPSRALDSI